MEVLLLQEVVAMMSAEDEAEMRDAVRWFRDMEVVLIDEDRPPKVIKLDKLQRYMLLKLIWRSSLYDIGEKKRMLERER
jgi:hypothetical protein